MYLFITDKKNPTILKNERLKKGNAFFLLEARTDVLHSKKLHTACCAWILHVGQGGWYKEVITNSTLILYLILCEISYKDVWFYNTKVAISNTELKLYLWTWSEPKCVLENWCQRLKCQKTKGLTWNSNKNKVIQFEILHAYKDHTHIQYEKNNVLGGDRTH